MIILAILGLAVLILAHEAGHFFAARSVGIGVKEFAIGFPPRWFRKKRGETEYTIGVLPLGGFVRLEGEMPGEAADPKRSFNKHSAGARMWVLVAGVVANFLLAWLLFAVAFSIGANREVILSQVVAESPAEAAGLEFGDAILAVTSAAGEKKIAAAEDFISEIEKNKGQEIVLEFKRGEEVKMLALTPRANPPAGEGPLGVAVAETGWASRGIFTALKDGFKETLNYSLLIVTGLWQAVTESGAANLSGPVGVAVIAGQAGSLGLPYLAHFFGLLSINLAILNLLPLPALDGGRLILVLGETIFRRRVPARAERWWNGFGISLLLLLMLYVTVQDLIRLF